MDFNISYVINVEKYDFFYTVDRRNERELDEEDKKINKLIHTLQGKLSSYI